MKDQTFGVEVEMYNISRKCAAYAVARFFGTTDTVNYVGGAYDAWTCDDQKGHVWQFMNDSSIYGPSTQCCEMVTPILHYDDMDLLQEVVRQLRHAGAKSDADHGCGVHIHIGAQGQTPQSIRNLVNIMAGHEALITKALMINVDRLNTYCKPVDPRFLAQINTVKPQTMQDLADVWYRSQGADSSRTAHYNRSRYHMLNLHATFTKGTIEFRLFQFDRPKSNHRSGLHAGKLKAYIQFCLAICNTAKLVKKASPKPNQTENEKFAMRTWLNRLGMIGDEFKMARKFFMERLDGDAAWRHAA